TYKEKGEVLLARLVERIADISKVDQPPHMEGRSMITILVPDRSKKKVEGKEGKEGKEAKEVKVELKVEPVVEAKPVAG
ncbi:MAG TPA: hypothetical protein VLT13_01795, partial [Bacteroidota bacterium]|nr:hypothetical protein [Bacteroidota bacterium]